MPAREVAPAAAAPQLDGPPLAQALAHLRAQRVQAAIDALLVAWRDTRAPAIADVIDRATMHHADAGTSPLPLGDRRSTPPWSAAFERRSDGGDAAAPRSTIPAGTPKHAELRLAALATLPDDPRDRAAPRRADVDSCAASARSARSTGRRVLRADRAHPRYPHVRAAARSRSPASPAATTTTTARQAEVRRRVRAGPADHPRRCPPIDTTRLAAARGERSPTSTPPTSAERVCSRAIAAAPRRRRRRDGLRRLAHTSAATRAASCSCSSSPKAIGKATATPARARRHRVSASARSTSSTRCPRRHPAQHAAARARRRHCGRGTLTWRRARAAPARRCSSRTLTFADDADAPADRPTTSRAFLAAATAAPLHREATGRRSRPARARARSRASAAKGGGRRPIG